MIVKMINYSVSSPLIWLKGTNALRACGVLILKKKMYS